MEVLGFIRKMRLNFSTRFFTKFSTRFSGVSSGEVLMKGQEVVASRVIAGGHFDGHFRGPFAALVRDVFSNFFFSGFSKRGSSKGCSLRQIDTRKIQRTHYIAKHRRNVCHARGQWSPTSRKIM